MATSVNKNSSFLLLVLAVVFVYVPCINACGACKPAHPSPPPPSPTPSPPPSPTPCPPPAKKAHCPKDTLKLGVCADLLGLVHVVIGGPPSGSKCCALIQGLADVEAAACLCTAIKANVLGINLDVPVTLSVLLSACQKTLPSDFTCA